MTIAVRDHGTGSSKNVKTSQDRESSPDVPVYVPHQNLDQISEGDYETVAASQTDQILGAVGAPGDMLHGLLIIPATTAAGSVSIKDGGGGSSITVFTGGGTLSDLKPFVVGPLWLKSLSGAWRVTTGSNVSVIAFGNFT